MDSDTTTRVGDHARILGEFETQGDVLVGTQMVAKGLDYPTVTLAAVVAADLGLHLPDFRAAERSFALIAQVCGRSGRARRGEAIVQTYAPEHPAIRFAAAHDYEGFAEAELRERAAAGFPPARAPDLPGHHRARSAARRGSRATRMRRCCASGRSWRCWARRRIRSRGSTTNGAIGSRSNEPKPGGAARLVRERSFRGATPIARRGSRSTSILKRSAGAIFWRAGAALSALRGRGRGTLHAPWRGALSCARPCWGARSPCAAALSNALSTCRAAAARPTSTALLNSVFRRLFDAFLRVGALFGLQDPFFGGLDVRQEDSLNRNDGGTACIIAVAREVSTAAR